MYLSTMSVLILEAGIGGAGCLLPILDKNQVRISLSVTDDDSGALFGSTLVVVVVVVVGAGGKSHDLKSEPDIRGNIQK